MCKRLGPVRVRRFKYSLLLLFRSLSFQNKTMMVESKGVDTSLQTLVYVLENYK